MLLRSDMSTAFLWYLTNQSAIRLRDKSGSTLTGPDVARQVFCTFEASGAMATRVGESVHRYLWCA